MRCKHCGCLLIHSLDVTEFDVGYLNKDQLNRQGGDIGGTGACPKIGHGFGDHKPCPKEHNVMKLLLKVDDL